VLESVKPVPPAFAMIVVVAATTIGVVNFVPTVQPVPPFVLGTVPLIV
jgi:hypothetical protein